MSHKLLGTYETELYYKEVNYLHHILAMGSYSKRLYGQQFVMKVNIKKRGKCTRRARFGHWPNIFLFIYE